jgi:preprotein translocase subunit SecE
VNRAVRRQQRAAEAKQKAGGGAPKSPSMRTSAPKTAGAQRAQKATPTRGGLLGWRPKFMTDIISELRKVVWPSREDTLYMAVVVCIVTVIFGALLGGIDIAFAWLIDKILLDPDALLR